MSNTKILRSDLSVCLQIYKDSRPAYYIDAKARDKSNWMRYVNCARNEEVS